MRPKAADIALALTLSASLASGAGAQSSNEGAPFLLFPVGAQGVALGRAMTWVEGAEGAFWNPAGLARLERSQAILVRGDHAVGPATALTGLWSHPGSGSLAASYYLLAASYYLLDVGGIDLTDEFGNYTGTLTVRNHLGVISGAAPLSEALSAGVSFKVIRYQSLCRGLCGDEGTTATTYAVDVGVQGRVGDRTRVGAMVAHLGPALQVVNAEQADPLPTRLRLAVAYDVIDALTEAEALRGWLAYEVQDRLKEPGTLSHYLGAEFSTGTSEALSLRAGYVWSDLEQDDGARVGLGLRYERFDLSIAKSLVVSTLTGETEPVHVTFSIGF